MEDYTFKKYSEIEIIEEVTDTTHVLIEQDGDIRRVSTSQIGKVKTVNGTEPDESGNVELAKPNLNQNDPEAPNYVEGRTHWVDVVRNTFSYSFVDAGNNAYEFHDLDLATILHSNVGNVVLTINNVEYTLSDNYTESRRMRTRSLVERNSGTETSMQIRTCIDWVGQEDYIVFFHVGAYSDNPLVITIGVDSYTFHKLDEQYIPEDIVGLKTIPIAKGVGVYSIVEGYNTTASGEYSHAEGHSTIASGDYSHAEGYSTTASGEYSHAEGHHTTASGNYSYAESYYTKSSGESSHAEGFYTTASGYHSHAEGFHTTASGSNSHVEGQSTIAAGPNQHVQGEFNIEDGSGKYAHIVGNGNYNTRSNAHTLDWEGNAWYAGTLKLGGTSYDDASEVALKSETVLKSELLNGIVLNDQVNGYDYVVQMRNGNLVSYCALSSIEVTTLPIKVAYVDGEAIDTTGMVITGTCQDGTTKVIDGYTCTTDVAQSSIVVSFVEADVVHTTSFSAIITPFDPTVQLVDFKYTDNENGTYTITSWKGTLNGVSSTEMIIPNNSKIIV